MTASRSPGAERGRAKAPAAPRAGSRPGPGRPVIGLALGSGSARGWAHFGVIHALRERGIRPDVVSGTSIGAVVGAYLAAGRLEEMEAWIRSLTRREVVSLLDIKLAGGLIGGERLFERLRSQLEEGMTIEDCALPYGAVATNLATGNEVWLREGSLLDAVRASSALPGLFAPVALGGRWLVDGGLVNPVPVSLCRAMGADVVIAVDLNADLLERYAIPPARSHSPGASRSHGGRRPEEGEPSWTDRLGELIARVRRRGGEEAEDAPSVREVLARSLNIMSVRITRSRMAGDPPDVVLAPRLSRVALMDFHRAEEAIAEGRAEVARKADQLELVLR